MRPCRARSNATRTWCREATGVDLNAPTYAIHDGLFIIIVGSILLDLMHIRNNQRLSVHTVATNETHADG